MEDKETFNELIKCLNGITETNKQLSESNKKLIETNQKLIEMNQSNIDKKEEQDDKFLKEAVDLIKKITYAFVITIGLIIIIFCSVIV